MTEDNAGAASLHNAIFNDDFESVQQLIKDGADLNLPNDKGLRPLDIAIMKNNKRIVKLLLASAEKNDKKIEVDMTTWVYAIMVDNDRITKCLTFTRILSEVKNSQGETVVHYCVKYRSLNILNIIQENLRGSVINQVDVNGYSPLHLAVIYNDEKMVKRLLELGGDVYLKTVDGKSSIHLAVKHQCFDILLLLINTNIDVNDPVTSTGENTLHLAVKNNDLPTVNLLIRSGGNVNCTDNVGTNLLHVAVNNGHEDMIKLLLKKNLNINARYGEKQKSVLDLALFSKNFQIIEAILNCNPDLNSKNRDGLSAIFNAMLACPKYANDIFLLKPDLEIVTNNGSSLLHYAIMYQQNNIAIYLIENNINIEIKDNEGKNALHYAALYGDAKVMSLLVSKNLDVNAKTTLGKTPLHLAVSSSSIEIVDVIKILLDSGAEVNAVDTFERTPLFYISKEKKVCELLLNKGANINHFDINGNGLLCYDDYDPSTSLIHNKDVFSFLIEHNINLNKINNNNDNIYHFMAKNNLSFRGLKFISIVNVNAVNNNNQTPLNLCLENGARFETVDYLIKNQKAIANENKENETPLHLAIKAQVPPSVNFFLANGANINDITVSDSTVLHYAVQYGRKNENIQLGILKLLIDSCNLDNIINEENLNGKTALHLAVLEDSLSIVKLLLTIDCIDVSVRDADDKSPLYYAIANKNRLMVKLLLNKGACTDDMYSGLSIYDIAERSGDKHIYQTVLLY